jgi:hypothetical protein
MQWSGAMQPDDYMSFLVRLWREQPDNREPASYHGEIEHIQSGVCWRFTSFELLLAFLQQAVIAPQNVTPDGLQRLAGENLQP